MKAGKILLAGLAVSAMLWAAFANADDKSSKLTNQSKQNGANGYYLVQEKIVGENDCVKVEGNKKLNPGDSAQLKVKDDCKWGVVEYKIFSVSDDKEIGRLGHSFRDGNFTIDIVSVCKGDDCSFTGITPEQNKGR